MKWMRKIFRKETGNRQVPVIERPFGKEQFIDLITAKFQSSINERFFAPISGTSFMFENSELVIVTANEMKIVIPQEDFVAFLNYVVSDINQ